MTTLVRMLAAAILVGIALAASAADIRLTPKAASPVPEAGGSVKAGVGQPPDIGALTERVARLRHARDVLRREASTSLPRDLSKEELAEARRYTAWLEASAKRLETLAMEGDMIIDGAAGSKPDTRILSHLNELYNSFDLKCMALQQEMERQNRALSMVSNVTKARHETAENVISNIR